MSPGRQEFLRLLEEQHAALLCDRHPPGAAVAGGWQPMVADEPLAAAVPSGPAPEPDSQNLHSQHHDNDTFLEMCRDQRVHK